MWACVSANVASSERLLAPVAKEAESWVEDMVIVENRSDAGKGLTLGVG